MTEQPLSVRPSSTLLIGPAGAGKTTSLVTLIEAGLSLRMLATEPKAPARIVDELNRRNLPIDKFDWQFVSPSISSWSAMRESAEQMQRQTLEEIAKSPHRAGKSDVQKWFELLKAIENFTSAKTGTDLGDATTWGPGYAFVIDGLTGINIMSRNLTSGMKPNPSPGEWGAMQGNIYNLLNKLCSDCQCFLVVIAHIERETNELTGTGQMMVSTLGAKLAPRLPPLFTNCIYAKRVKEVYSRVERRYEERRSTDKG
jgi:hypothetical protein